MGLEVDRRTSIARVALVCAALVVVVASEMPASPAATALKSGRFRMLVDPTELTLCVGEQKTIKVRIPVVLPPDEVGDDESPYLHIPDQAFYSQAEPSGVVSIPPGGVTGADPGSPAYFPVDGLKAGEADITLSHGRRDELLYYLPFGWRAAPRAPAVTIHVTVERCYEAYASALESTFTDKDMGGLDEPFTLAGYLANTAGLTATTTVMFFAPHPQSPDHSNGVYAKIEQVSAQGVPCTNFSSGGYHVVFYTPSKSDGDLVLDGTVTLVCMGHVVATGPESVLVAFRAKAEGSP